MLFHRFWSLVAIGSLIAGLAASCSVSHDEAGLTANGGTFGFGGRDSSTGGGAGVDIGPPDRGHDSGESIHPLCLSCDPDETLDVCTGFDAGVADAASDRDARGSDGARPFGAEYGPDAPNLPAPPGASEAGLRADAGSDGAPLPDWGCRIQGRDPDRRAVCAKAGNGKNGDPCVSSADCAVGHACTGNAGVAQCRALCCNGSETCEAGRYCAERPQREETEELGNGLMVPACVLADDCDLAEPYPCRTATCKCPDGTACTVVRTDGTTSCVKPGTGMAGDACPCAWGHICSQGTGKCLKLCLTDPAQSDCGSGRCQGGNATLPEGWGTCVGGKPGDGGP